MSIRLVVVDDDPLVRAGLLLILGGSDDIDVVAEAQDGREAVQAVRTFAPDVVLMDIRMPVLDGIAATAELNARPNPPKIIVLTTFDADEFVVRALGAGASGFLLKDTPPAEIVEAVHKVAAGEPMLSPAITRQLIQQVTHSSTNGRNVAARSKVQLLTEREREVAIAIASGAPNAQIANELHMSLATVKAHISHIFTKLEASNRVQVAICMHDADLT